MPASSYVCVVAGRLFTKQEVDEIMATTVKKVVLAVTNIPDYAIQDNPFFLTGLFHFTSNKIVNYETMIRHFKNCLVHLPRRLRLGHQSSIKFQSGNCETWKTDSSLSK